MFQGVRVFDPRPLFYGRPFPLRPQPLSLNVCPEACGVRGRNAVHDALPVAPPTLVPKRLLEACGVRGRGLLRSPPPQ